MKHLSLTLGTLAAIALGSSASAEGHILEIEGAKGPGSGKKIVLIAGDEEYRSEESAPMLAKILSNHHGFDTSVVFSWDTDGNFIDPNNQSGLRGLDELADADLMIIGTRFRNPSPSEAQHITEFLNAGKPVIGFRTATHGFKGKSKFGDSLTYDDFGLKILGEKWVSHHGKHKGQGTLSVAESANADHPILSGVSEISGPSDVYGVKHLTDADTILLRGAVTDGLEPDSKPVEGDKNNPMMPLAWLHTYTAPDGQTTGTSLCTTMGASLDFADEDLRRLIVNAAYHLTGLEVPASAKVDFVDPFYPAFYGFIKNPGFWKSQDLTLDDLKPGASHTLEDPKGSPELKTRLRAPQP